MTYSLKVADMPASERPRKRLMSYGSRHLATAELIAILLGTGQGAGKLSAVGLGQYLLHELGKYQPDPLSALRTVTVAELTKVPGIGQAKATTILAAIEVISPSNTFEELHEKLVEYFDNGCKLV